MTVVAMNTTATMLTNKCRITVWIPLFVDNLHRTLLNNEPWQPMAFGVTYVQVLGLNWT
jgi:hypothetical protein